MKFFCAFFKRTTIFLFSAALIYQPRSAAMLPYPGGPTHTQALLTGMALHPDHPAHIHALLQGIEERDINLVRDALWHSGNRACLSINVHTGDTPLIHATRKRSIGILRMLLAANANPCIQNKTGETALIIAARQGDTWAAQELIAAGAPLETRDINGNTALSEAILYGNRETVDSLIHAGASINTTNRLGATPLMRAIMHKKKKMAFYLSMMGAKVTTKNIFGYDAIHFAGEIPGMLELLPVLAYYAGVECGETKASGYMPGALAGTTPLMRCAYTGDILGINTALNSGNPIDGQNYLGHTALMAAAITGQTAAIESLMQAGANPYLTNDTGKTAALLAQEYNNHASAIMINWLALCKKHGG